MLQGLGDEVVGKKDVTSALTMLWGRWEVELLTSGARSLGSDLWLCPLLTYELDQILL